MHKKLLIALIFVLSIFAFQTSAYAALNLILTQGVSGAVPIAIVPFAGQENMDQTDPTNIAQTISTDLQNSGRFQSLANSKFPATPHSDADVNYAAWQALKQNNLVIGKVT